MEIRSEADKSIESFPNYTTHLVGPIPSLDLHWLQRIHANIEETYPEVSQEEKIELIANDVNNIAEARIQILKADTYHYANGVARLLAENPLDPKKIADVTALRLQGDLLAIPDHEQWLYPDFQFDKNNHQVRPIVKVVNEAFKDMDPWDTLFWWHTSYSIGAKERTLAQEIDNEQVILDRLIELGRITPEYANYIKAKSPGFSTRS